MRQMDKKNGCVENGVITEGRNYSVAQGHLKTLIEKD